MIHSSLNFALLISLLGAGLSEARSDEEAVAFVTETSVSGVVSRVDGTSEEVQLGSQLAPGDEVSVTEGQVVLIYLSGGTVMVEPGSSHTVTVGEESESPLIARLSSTLSEIASPLDEEGAPTVQGMARGLAISGTSPANSLVASADFAFTWNALEGVSEYVVELSGVTGSSKQSKVVSATGSQATAFSIVPGERYTWTVRESVMMMPRSSNPVWFEVADSAAARSVSEKIETIELAYTGHTRDLLQAVAYYDAGYYYDAERLLQVLMEAGSVKAQVQPLLFRIYAKTGRLDQLPPTREH